MLLALGGCEVAEPELDEPSREEAVALAEAQVEARASQEPSPEPAPPMDAPAIGVELSFDGVAPLHQGFFADAQALSLLGRSMHGHHADPVPVRVSFDSERHLGTIRLQIDPGALSTPIRRHGDTIRLADLAPVTTALAAYRSDLASRLDFRIQSFHIRLFSVRGRDSCTFELAGKPPPDGRTISPCVIVDSEEHCGQPGAEGVTFAPKVANKLAACLDI